MGKIYGMIESMVKHVTGIRMFVKFIFSPKQFETYLFVLYLVIPTSKKKQL